jgi:hypothetical protein
MDIAKVGSLISVVRGQRVMLDSDLAALYGVLTGNLKRAVDRNGDRFPLDFSFELSREEYESLRCQIGILEKGRHSKYLPRVFTEQGVAMLSGVLNSDRAVQVNVAIMRAFVRLRQALALDPGLADRMEKAVRLLGSHEEELGEHAVQINEVFAAIRRLIGP